MKPSERMRKHLQREQEPPPEDQPVPERPDRLAELERQQMEDRKQDALSKSLPRRKGRVIWAQTHERGRPPRYKRW